MKLSDFDFDLPDALIATRPANPRTSARLLYANDEQIEDRHVFDLPDILRAGDLLVLNNTKVIPARHWLGSALGSSRVTSIFASPDPCTL